MTYSSVILEKYGEHIFPKGFSTDYGRYRSQLTTKKSQEKSSVNFAQNVRKVAPQIRTLRPEGGVNVIFSVFTYVTELLKTNK